MELKLEDLAYQREAIDAVVRLFAEKYQRVCKEKFGREPTDDEIFAIQGFYFAQTAKGEYTDNERTMRGSKELFDLILKQKEELLRIGNPVEFIFSHSALGVGWDNPNIFNIATLNQSYSEIKKRQEIGRGLRICVNQDGQRVYDAEDCPEGEEVNLLTIVPNEITDKKALRESEVYKIKCAMKHFDAPGVDAHIHYDAPVKDYPAFKSRAKEVLHG